MASPFRRGFSQRHDHYNGYFPSDDETVYDSDDDLSLLGAIEYRRRRKPLTSFETNEREGTGKVKHTP
ncbi:hypothetical protein VTO42DRAFT_4378 [Malbranchea cinnamomea]